MKHQSQKEWVKQALLDKKYITRNSCLARRITRLSAIIQDLEEEGFVFEAFKYQGDYVYKLISHPYKIIERYVPQINKIITSYE